MSRKPKFCTLNLSQLTNAAPLQSMEARDAVRNRLAEACALLEVIDRQRLDGEDSHLGRAVEERIIWRELLDLELQDVDEQIERISAAAQEIGD